MTVAEKETVGRIPRRSRDGLRAPSRLPVTVARILGERGGENVDYLSPNDVACGINHEGRRVVAFAVDAVDNMSDEEWVEFLHVARLLAEADEAHLDGRYDAAEAMIGAVEELYGGMVEHVADFSRILENARSTLDYLTDGDE